VRFQTIGGAGATPLSGGFFLQGGGTREWGGPLPGGERKPGGAHPPLCKKADDHVGSGLDKPDPKGLVEKVIETVKTVGQPGTPPVPGDPAPVPPQGRRLPDPILVSGPVRF